MGIKLRPYNSERQYLKELLEKYGVPMILQVIAELMQEIEDGKID